MVYRVDTKTGQVIETIKKTLQKMLGTGVQSVLITDYDPVNSMRYYSLMLNSNTLTLVEHNQVSQTETVINFDAKSIAINGEASTVSVIHDIKIKIGRIGNDLVSKKAFIFEKSLKGNRN